MLNPKTDSSAVDAATPITPQPVSPLKCFTGSLVAGSLGLLLYRLMTAIALSFASHPAANHQPLAYNLSVAVRTLVVGMVTLATGVFALASLGLFALGIKLLLQGPSPDLDGGTGSGGS